MPSSFSSRLRLELVATGEQAGTWGTTTNTNLGTLIEEAISGTATHSTAGAGDTTLTQNNGSTDEARNAVIKLTGVLTGSHNVICPSVSKLYLVINATTGAFSITFKTAAGTGVVVPQGSYMFLYCDGTNVLNSMTGQQLVTPALGTPTSGTLTNCTGLPASTGIAGLATGVATFLATPSSANLAAALTDETGTGAAVFANSPTLVTPALGTPSALVGTNITGTANGLNIGGSAGSIAGLPLASGTYTPTITNNSNTNTLSASTANYVRVGSLVHVTGAITFTTSGTNWGVDLTLPVASNFAYAADCTGAVGPYSPMTVSYVQANVVFKTANIGGSSSSSPATLTLGYSYMYQIR